MKNNTAVTLLRAQVWEQVMALPVAYNEYIYDELGASFNSAVTTLVNQLTTNYLESSEISQCATFFPEIDIAQIVERVRFFINSSLGKVHSYEAMVGAYLLDIS